MRKGPVLAPHPDTQDGGLSSDNFLNDPRDCHFDPASVQCKVGQDPATCLSPAQVKAVRKIYGGPHDPQTGKVIFPGYEPGGESGANTNWTAYIVGTSPTSNPQQLVLGVGYYANFVFQDPNFDLRTMNFTTDVAFAESGVGQILDVVDPDLSPFKQRGGKIIQYHGWADGADAPMNSVNYYNEVRGALKGPGAGNGSGSGSFKEIQDFYRLFMVPGMAHCTGGEGPNAFGNLATAPLSWTPTTIYWKHSTAGSKRAYLLRG